jgi:hypothetical protein
MDRIVVKSRVGSDGVLQLALPVGPADAGREVQVTVEPVGPPALSPNEWRQGILDAARKWQGEFEQPEQGENEQREPLSRVTCSTPTRSSTTCGEARPRT